MFKKVHLRLTLVFTLVGVLILCVMSVIYLYFNGQSLRQNTWLRFQSDIDTITARFGQNTSISYDWMRSMQQNYNYAIYVYDNGVPFRFVNDTKTQTQLQLAQQLQLQYQSRDEAAPAGTEPSHVEFSCNVDGQEYDVSVITIPGKKSNSEIYVVHSLADIEAQLRQLYLRFALVILVSSGALFAFSWFYTRRLLRPIDASRLRQTQFIAAASHEIRNPVNTMLSALGAMEQCSDTQRREFVAIAQKEGKRLTRLTNDLLMLARSDNQAFSMAFGRTELDTIVLDCYEAFLQPARDAQIQLTVELPEAAMTAAQLDGERIKQVLAILLDNAISYTLAGGKIHLTCGETPKCFRLQVADNGSGIPDAQKQQIFERFYRADAARESKEHFGLGLCIAYEIVQQHHGCISVEDTPGGGATFVVLLPKRKN